MDIEMMLNQLMDSSQKILTTLEEMEICELLTRFVLLKSIRKY
jgi:hypothetical protein